MRARIALLLGLAACTPSFPAIEMHGDAGEPRDAETPDALAGDGDVEHDSGTAPIISPIVSLSRGMSIHHTCARREDGTVTCWGDNTAGQLARTEPGLLRPRDLGIGPVDEIALGAEHTCVRTGGDVRCFGRNNQRQLGNGSTALSESTPIAVSELHDATALSAGYAYTCALRAGGQIACWGGMAIEMGGDPTPREVGPFPARAIAVEAGAQTAGAILENGELWTWGEGGCNRLGNGREESHVEPVHVSALPAGARVIDAALGDLHGCALMDSHDLYCWGCSGVGQVGTGTTTRFGEPITTPVRVLEGAVSVDASLANTCARMEDGSARCWGANDVGLVGNGVQLPADIEAAPVDVVGVSGVLELELFWKHGCARLAEGVACWGYDNHGQLGDGSKIDTSHPILIVR